MLFLIAREAAGASCAPGIPCALAFQGPANDASPGRIQRRGNADMRLRAGGMVDLSASSNQNKFARKDGKKKWSEWQDSNLRPLLPERKK